MPLSTRVAAANAALAVTAMWGRAHRTWLQQQLAETTDVAIRTEIEAELARLDAVLPDDPTPIYTACAQDGQSDPHRDRVVADVQALLHKEGLGFGKPRTAKLAAAIVDRLGVA